MAAENKALDILIDDACDETKRPMWECGWTVMFPSHISHATLKGYSFLNCMRLESVGEYATADRIKKEGGSFIGKPSIIWSCVPKIREEKDKETGELKKKCYGTTVKFTKVWKIEEGVSTKGIKALAPGKYPPPKNVSIDDAIPEIEAWIAEYCKRENIKMVEDVYENEAYFVKYGDSIHLKRRDYFKSLADFYAVVFHELAHSSGRKDKLNRFDHFNDEMGDLDFKTVKEEYAYEELVAEMTSAILRTHFGIQNVALDRSSVAYIQSWGKRLKADKKIFCKAANRAEEAARFLLTGEKPAILHKTIEEKA